MAIVEWLTVIVLALIFFEDLKHRGVSWYYFLILLTLVFWYFVEKNGEWPFVWVNTSFVVGQLAMVTLWGMLRKNTIRVVNQYLGLGDILFWAVMVFAFSPLNFIVYFITSVLFSLVCFGLFVRGENRTIPLAGFQSLFFVFLIVLRAIGIQWSNYDDYQLLNLVYGG